MLQTAKNKSLKKNLKAREKWREKTFYTQKNKDKNHNRFLFRKYIRFKIIVQYT